MTYSSKLKNGATVKAGLHKNLIIIKVEDDPISWQRPIFQYTKEMQDEKMMFFQHKLQYILLGMMYQKGWTAFRSAVDMQILIRTKKSLNDFRLEYVLKAVLDGCNQHIILDDQLIQNIVIDVIPLKGRQRTDQIEIVINEPASGRRLEIQTDLIIAEKRLPIAYNISARSVYDQVQLNYQADLQRALSTVLQPYQTKLVDRRFECHIRFDTSNFNQDADNMALMYLPVLRKLLMPVQDQLKSIGLYKRDTSDTSINGTSINLLLIK
jgi:hypothetical protein